MTRVVLSTAVAAALLLPASGAAAPATVPLPAQRNALEVCIALTEPDNPGVDRSDTDARLRQPDNRVEGRDWSGQNLAGRSFSGKVLLDVKLKGASLRGADLTDAIICRSDLTNADLAGARLDRVLIGGWTELNGADLTNASARGLTIADASGAIRIDGADLRDASIMCDPEETTRCIGTGVTFVSMKGADLRGGVVDHLCCAAPGLGSARLAGVTTQLNGYGDIDFIQLAAGTGQSGRITFIPDYGFSGRRTEFTGEELRRLAGVVGRMRSASAHPSFDCSRAATKVEKAICTDPQLAALDSALSWLWDRVEHTPDLIAEQRAWLDARANCPPAAEDPSAADWSLHSFISAADPQACIALSYARRIRDLAAKASPVAIPNGTYTTDRPLQLPQGGSAALAEKFLTARGFRRDEITVEGVGGGAGKITGYGLWANGHQCGFEATVAEMGRVGAQFRIEDGAAPSDDHYSVSFVITPQVAIRVGGSRQFQCGARGGWSDVYFRQPDRLMSKIKNRHDGQ